MHFIEIADFFLPRLCFSCSTKLSPEENSVCSVCLLKFVKTDDTRIRSEFNRKFRSKGFITEFRSLYVFQKQKEIQQLIHSLKYGRKFKAGIFLGNKIGDYFSDVITGWDIHLIIPVPLHNAKKAERGFNQSAYIARGLARNLNMVVNERIICRARNTLSQTNMNLSEREENIKNAFKVKNSGKIRNKNILLVDDVITTGSTLNECASTLKSSGSAEIYAISAAIADLD